MKRFILTAFIVFLTAAFFALQTGCLKSQSENSEGLTQDNHQAHIANNSKLSDKLEEIISAIKQIEDSTNQASDLEKLSNLFVKVDGSGKVQVYIYCSEISDDYLKKLLNLGLKVEVVNREYKVIQGWLPYDKIDEASKLEFINKITPPSYGHTR